MTKRNKAMQLALGLNRFAKHMETEQHKMWGMKIFCYHHPGTSFTFRTVQEIKDMSANIAKGALAMHGMLANSYQQDYLNQSPLSVANKRQIAELAVGQADALIEFLEGKPVEATQIVDSGATGYKIDSQAIEELKVARAELQAIAKNNCYDCACEAPAEDAVARIDKFLKENE